MKYVLLLSRLHKAKLVGRRRLELPTSPLSGARSNQLSYRPTKPSLLSSLPTYAKSFGVAAFGLPS